MSIINNQKIAKNTLFLYIRMFLILGVSLYTSRILLKALGIEDYGIYNLIAGFITLFVVVTNSLVDAVQRYFNFALGEKNDDRFSRVFVMSMNILFLLAILIIIITETLGVWFINTQLNIPSDRLYAANWVFQLAILTFITSILRTPYNAAIISHEKMSFYAYVSIIDVFMKLSIAFLITSYNSDKLIFYSVLLLITNLITTIIYKIYTNKKLDICKYIFVWDKNLFKELFSFSSWSLIGQTGYILRTQGDSFLVNRFYSVAVNAAMGINGQVLSAAGLFVNNFQAAFNPQLTKSYAANEIEEHVSLLFRGSKFSYFLMLILSLPIMFNIDLILEIWLVEVPEYTALFCIYGLISNLVISMSAPLGTSILATGKIKKYQMSLLLINISGIALSFIALQSGFKPYIVAIVNIIVQIYILLFRLYFVRKGVEFEMSNYLKNIIYPVFFVTSLSTILPYYSRSFSSDLFSLVLIFVINTLITSLIVYLIGLSKNEKIFVKKIIYMQVEKIRNK